jgi:formylglycine-generating enzyme required for sulfatase activity
MKLIRGGSWRCDDERALRTASLIDLSLRFSSIGFRCVCGAAPTASIRGGAWDNYPFFPRPTYRSYDDPSERDNYLGFRCVRRIA